MFDSFSPKDVIRYAEGFNLGKEVRELIYKMGYSPSDALDFFCIA